MFNFFDRVYCIHLPKHTDRLKSIQKQFKRVGIEDVEYVHVTPPPQNFTMSNMRRNSLTEFGVNLSHIKAIVKAMSDGVNHPLFLEDDVVFCENAQDQLERALSELPEEWDVFYLGGHPRGRIESPQARMIGKYLAKVGTFSFADAYCINGKSIRSFFDLWCEKITQENAMYDFILGEYASKNKAYCTYPLICEQAPGMSYVSGKYEDKSSIVARAWTNHLGDKFATPGHLEITKKWREENPVRWKEMKQRQQRRSDYQ